MRSASTLGDEVLGADVDVEDDEACVDNGGEGEAGAEDVDIEDDAEEAGVARSLSASVAALNFLVGAGRRSTFRLLL
jgi:hypothetical protein